MKHIKGLTGSIIFLIFMSTSLTLQANPDVTSREYKLMLDINGFAFNTEYNNVVSFLSAAKIAIQTAISRNVIGSAYLARTRSVMFYDTSGSCELKNHGYSFRERVENGDSEVTLKFRSADRYISDFEDLSASSSSAKAKLEADISSSSTTAFKVVYSHSTSVPNTRTINEMKDINSHFPGFESDYGFSNSIALNQVGNLTIREHVYKGLQIDLGKFDAEISVTLWYNVLPSGSQKPVVAEVSFKYADRSADYTKAVVNRAEDAFYALQSLGSWTNPDSKTKTQFVYDYDPIFCN